MTAILILNLILAAAVVTTMVAFLGRSISSEKPLSLGSGIRRRDPRAA